jgi:predicted MPP superfamily phosphohydrolase
MTGILADLPQTENKTSVTRRNFLRGSAAVVAGLALYAGEIARHEISVLTHDIAITKLPNAFHGLRIAQISDIHFDEYTEPSFLRRVVAQTNSLAPDLVLLTGDYISVGPLGHDFAHGAIFRCAEILRGLTCPQRFAIMGNHDMILGSPNIREALATASIPLMTDQHIPLERSGQRLWLAGIVDPTTGTPNLDQAIPARPDGPVLLMSHAPDFADIVLAHPRGHLVDLILSGHTHGGQVRFPFLGALSLPPLGKKYVEGLFRFNKLQLYVNRGIGTVGLPFRLNCPPEITLFTLKNSGEL